MTSNTFNSESAAFPYLMESPLKPVVTLNGNKFIYFAGTGYFQLQSHPEVIRAAIEATEKFGIGSATSRTINGTTPLLIQLEKKIAEYFQTEDAAYLPSGYLSNLAGLQALQKLKPFDVIFIDENAHYSNQSGAMATGKKIIPFRHLNVEDLKNKIKTYLGKNQKPLIITDGLFPIWGTIAPIPEYLELAEKFNGIIWTDDSHSVGILGKNGRGSYEHYNLNSPKLFMGATLSKAFGAYGGFVAGNNSFINTLKKGPVTTGTNSPPNALAAAALKGLEIVQNNPGYRQNLYKNALYLKHKLTKLGLPVEDNNLPIITFSFNDENKMQNIQTNLMQQNIFIQFIKYIGSSDKGVLRIVISSAHTTTHINKLVEALKKVL